MTASGPLRGIRVLDCSALGPGPFGSRMLADHGAEVVSVEAPTSDAYDAQRMYGRGKRSIVIDLKRAGAAELLLRIVPRFDVLIESMRPGKMEELGLGPDVVRACAPRLVYVRLTAFGQDGPLAGSPGHDINAIAIGGALGVVGLEQPLPPAGFVGDLASGSLMLVIGVLLALLERERSGDGRTIDVAMSDGVAYLMGGILPLHETGHWGARGTNLLDGSRPGYTTYQCRDGKWLAVGALEPYFFSRFLEGLGLRASDADRARIAARVREKTRDEWVAAFAERDTCVSPVLELDELADHPHHRARRSIFRDGRGVRTGIAPRLSGSAAQPASDAPTKGLDTEAVLAECGLSDEEIADLLASGVAR